MLRRFLELCICVMMTFCSLAHGDLHERIQLLTADIDRFPDDIDLYYQRGILYLEHEDYREAIRDFRHCEKREPRATRHKYGLARAHYLHGNYRKCIKSLHLSMEIQEPDGKVCLLLSQAYEKRGRYDEAYSWAHKNLDEAIVQRPDHYLALAHIYDLTDRKNLVIDILKKAIDQFGLVPSLTSQLLTTLVDVGDVEQAIHWQNKIVDSQSRREFALFDRARLYLLIHNLPMATNDLQGAQSRVSELPKHIRNSEAVIQLMEKTSALLKQIKMQDS